LRAVKHAIAQADRALEKLITVDSFNAYYLHQVPDLDQRLKFIQGLKRIALMRPLIYS
jgi:hypothetical protein